MPITNGATAACCRSSRSSPPALRIPGVTPARCRQVAACVYRRPICGTSPPTSGRLVNARKATPRIDAALSVSPLEPRAGHKAHQHMLEATIDDNLLPIDIPGAIAGEIQRNLRHVVRGRYAAKRHGGGATFQHCGVLVERLAHGRAHHPGADNVAADAVRP